MTRITLDKTPVNRQTALLISPSAAIPSSFSLPLGHIFSRDFPAHRVWELPEGIPNKIGKRRGQMTLVAYAGPSSRAMGNSADVINHKWIARCDCGNFEVRNYLTWKKKKSLPDECMECNYKKNLQERYELRKKGLLK